MMSQRHRLERMERVTARDDGKCRTCGDWPLPYIIDRTKARCPGCGSHTFEVHPRAEGGILIVDWTPRQEAPR